MNLRTLVSWLKRFTRHLISTTSQVRRGRNLTLYVARAYLNMADSSEEVESTSNESHSSEIVPNSNAKRIVRPLLKKIEAILALKENDSILVKQIKKEIQKDIEQRYWDEDINLKVAMFFGAQIQRDAFFNQ